MRKAVAYLRVSTIGQATEEKYGLREQKAIIEAYAEENGYEISEWYTDGGVSGVKESRPAMDALIYGDSVKSPQTEAVIVAKSDRIARDIKLYYYYLMLLEKKGVKLISATEPVVNDETGLGNIYRALMLFVAEQERNNLFMRTSLAKQKKRLNGGYTGGRPPYGYFVFNHELHVEPSEAKIVKTIFSLDEKGLKIPQIHKELLDRRLTNRKGTYFDYAAISRILKNELFYRGYYVVDHRPVLGKHEPILEIKLPEPVEEECEEVEDDDELSLDMPGDNDLGIELEIPDML